jgi:UDP-N-acetylmuramoylalanine--D-glutamate ligase
MKPRPPLPPGPFLVAGLARSGEAVALALHARGEEVIGTDSGSPDAGRLRDAGVEIHSNTSGTDLAARVRTLVKSPGVPQEAPVVAAARERGIAVVGELEIAWRLIENEFIAVTGTNGKTTTTELIGHIHGEAGLPVAVAGNVGTALSSLIGSVDPAATIVCETSSFQLEDTEHFAPEAAVLLNVAEDHLDRHGTMDAYLAAKLRIFRNQSPEDVAVLPAGLELGAIGAARQVRFGEEPLDAELGMRGPHNRENAMAAAAVCLARGIDPDAVRAGLRTFTGVAHRLEEVAEQDGVLYVNDSKATNVASTLVALASFPEARLHLILGGRGKGTGYEALRDPVAATCAAVYLIGETTEELAAALEGVPVPVERAGDLERAVAAARAAARPGEVVLLSPACTSFDQYRDFEARGEHFRALVEAA